MTARDTYAASVATAHTSAQTGSIAGLPGAPALTGNLGGWSRVAAIAALASGAIVQAQFVSLMQALASWESSQIQAAKDTLRATGDVAPV
jgi:hypothetical protein